jgi:hypothetical protein
MEEFLEIKIYHQKITDDDKDTEAFITVDVDESEFKPLLNNSNITFSNKYKYYMLCKCK